MYIIGGYRDSGGAGESDSVAVSVSVADQQDFFFNQPEKFQKNCGEIPEKLRIDLDLRIS